MAPKASGASVHPSSMVAQNLFTIQPRAAGIAAPRLKRDPPGWRVFELVLQSSMNAALRSLVMDHIKTGQLKPYTSDESDAYELVFNELIQRLEAEPDLIELISDKVETGNGIHALSVLRSKFAGNTPAKSLTVLGEMITIDLDSDPFVGAQRIVSLNSQLADDERFPNKLVTALVLHKLPASYSNLRDSTIASGTFPAPAALVDGIEQLKPFVEKAKSVSFASRGSQILCFNCDVRGHPVAECSQAKVDCDICGTQAGHLPKYCLVKNGKEIPASFAPAQREKIQRLREEYKKNGGKMISVAVVVKPPDDDDDYISFHGIPADWELEDY